MRAVSDDVAGQGGEPRERGHLHGVEQQGRHHRDDRAPHAGPAARTLRRAPEDRQSAGQVEAPGPGAEETHLRPAHHAELNKIAFVILDIILICTMLPYIQSTPLSLYHKPILYHTSLQTIILRCLNFIHVDTEHSFINKA